MPCDAEKQKALRTSLRSKISLYLKGCSLKGECQNSGYVAPDLAVPARKVLKPCVRTLQKSRQDDCQREAYAAPVLLQASCACSTNEVFRDEGREPRQLPPQWDCNHCYENGDLFP